MEATGYCLHDRVVVRIINPIRTRNNMNRTIITGNCELCGNIVHKICNEADLQNINDPK